MKLSAKQRFRLNRLLNRWEEWKAGLRQTKQAVTAEAKMCPSCRALVDRGLSTCPYCGQRLKVFSASPAGRVLTRVVPEGIPVTAFVILANLVLFAVECVSSGSLSPSGAVTLRLGVDLPLIDTVGLHQYWRLITACYLHAGLLHIGFNMWALYDLGPVVENFFGRAKFYTLYLLTGIFGYIVSGYFNQESLGASGAIFGLLGVLIAYGTKRSHTASGRELRGMAVRWAIYALILCFVIPGVDNYAHLGGLAAGFVLGMVVGDDPPLTDTQIRTWNVIAGIMVGLTLLSFFLMVTAPPIG